MKKKEFYILAGTRYHKATPQENLARMPRGTSMLDYSFIFKLNINHHAKAKD